MNRRYEVSSVGKLFKKSLEMFADQLVDENGNKITADEMNVNDKAYAVFWNGANTSRTSVIRIE